MHIHPAIILACLVTAAPAGADDCAPSMFSAGTTPLYARPEAGDGPIGKLLVTAPLRPVERTDSGWQRVVVPGWTQTGAERVLQAAPGIRVTRAAIAKTALEALHFGQTQDDPATGLRWQHTTLSGWIAPGTGTAPDLETLWARAEPLFSVRCTACHIRRVPGRYTANEWTSHLKVMGPRTGLPKDDQALIRAYLQYRSADAAALAEALLEDTACSTR